MDKLKLYRRTQALIFLIILLTIMFLYFLLRKSAVLTGLDVVSDEARKNTLENKYRAETVEGRILDEEGVVLSEGHEAGKNGLVTFPDAYSWLLGYNSKVYGAYGLRGRYEQYLYMQGKNKQGADIKLTLNNDLQMMANNLIAGTDGSLIVMEAKTGKILALASSKDLDKLEEKAAADKAKEAENEDTETEKSSDTEDEGDEDTVQEALPNFRDISGISKVALEAADIADKTVNRLTSREFDVNHITDYNMKRWSDLKGFFIQNGYKDQQEPGSVFKVITASAILEKGEENDVVDDQGSVYLGTHEISNVGKKARGEINLSQALGYSSNVYFATKGIELGGTVLKNKAESFLLNQDIALDFTTLSSNFDLGGFNHDLLADTAYGQGKTLVTPLQIAMIYQSIANGGKMMEPYMVHDISLDGKVLYKYKEKVLAEPIDQEVAGKLDGMLNKVATKYYGIEDTSIRAKTGTAQIPGTQKLYFASYNDDYVVVVSKISDEGYGRDLMGVALDVYSYLSSKKQNNQSNN